MSNNEKLKKIAIHGVPRSGTSWIGEIINSSPNTLYRFQPLFSYALKDYLTIASTSDEIAEFFDALTECEDTFINQKEKRKNNEFPIFKKGKITYIAYKEVRYINILFNLMRRADDVKLCGIIRNPCSVINSWLRAPREFRADLGWSETEEWRYALKKNLNKPEEYNGFEKWKEAANTFLELKKKYPKRVYIIKYGDMLLDPHAETEKLFSFVGLNVTAQTIEFLENSTKIANKSAYSVYRKNQKDNNWKKSLNDSISSEIISDLRGTHLEEFLF
jgi:hypothetical protein